MPARNARLTIKTTRAIKATLKQAANVLDLTLSEFLLDSALTSAREIIARSRIINLSHKETERFAAALEKPPKPNQKLKRLFKKYKTMQQITKVNNEFN